MNLLTFHLKYFFGDTEFETNLFGANIGVGKLLFSGNFGSNKDGNQSSNILTASYTNESEYFVYSFGAGHVNIRGFHKGFLFRTTLGAKIKIIDKLALIPGIEAIIGKYSGMFFKIGLRYKVN